MPWMKMATMPRDYMVMVQRLDQGRWFMRFLRNGVLVATRLATSREQVRKWRSWWEKGENDANEIT